MKNELGFGLADSKQEGKMITFDCGNLLPDTDIIPSTWMELNIPDNWTEEQIINHVKEWIKRERN